VAQVGLAGVNGIHVSLVTSCICRVSPRMKDAIFGFAGGMWAGRKCSQVQLPQLRCAMDEAEGFRLSVSVLAASISTLDAPGRLTRQRPRLEVGLGRVLKETSFATFSSTSTDASNSSNSSSSVSCPWRFDDTLMFPACPADILGRGLELRLRSHSDFRLGPFELELAGFQEIGHCTLDLRRRVLLACIRAKRCDPDGSGDGHDPGGGRQIWETPVLVIPLAPAGTETDDSRMDFDQAVAHITLMFSVSTNPETLMQQADYVDRPLAEKLRGSMRQVLHEPMRWVAQSSFAKCSTIEKASRPAQLIESSPTLPIAGELPTKQTPCPDVC